jgi:uncharacterized protein (DUF362 family)
VTERVSVVRCTTAASDAEVVRRTEDAIHALGSDFAALKAARRIALKINAGVPRIVLTEGKQTELTEPAVVEGTIRAIRSLTDAEIVVGDAPTDRDGANLYDELGYPEQLKPYKNVRLLDFGYGEMTNVEMRHPNAMFRSYMLHRELAEADAFVSVAKMKAHASMGCTLCVKNLFGWTPWSVYGAPRMYLHDRLIRLPRVLADLAAHFEPCLNVVDGIVAANKSEWHGEPLKPGVIVAGMNIVATDAVGARIMGFDPEGDYPNHPFFYRRNAIKLARAMGIGPTAAADIEVLGPQPEEVRIPFHVEPYHEETHRLEQLTTGAACVARYREEQDALAKTHRGRYLALFDGRVLWDGADMETMMRREKESGRDWRDVPQFTVRCLPRDEEIERLDTYAEEATLAGTAC